MFAVWFQTLRVRTLGASLAPVLVGIGFAVGQGQANYLWAAVALLGALLLQIGTNLANDYFDGIKGTDAERAGPPRATASGALSPIQVKRAMLLTFALAATVGITLGLRGGWPIFLIGGTGLVMGYAYTGGPYPLAYKGLGDVAVFAYFGPLAVAGTYLVQTGTWSNLALVLGIPVGLLSVAILVVNNIRDRPTDERASKNTIIVRFGDCFGQYYFITLIAASFATIFAISAAQLNVFYLLPLVTIPLVFSPLSRINGDLEPRAALNPALGETGKLLVWFSVAYAIGLTL